MLSAIHLQDWVIAPALEKIGLWSRSAEELVLGTAIVESGLTYIRQWGEGPALGLWQVEPSTQNDLYTNFLNYRPSLSFKINELRSAGLNLEENLATNLMYGAAICRLCYYRKSEPLPEAGDIEGQGQYWKQHYNTPLGKGTAIKYVYKVQKILEETQGH